MSTHTFAILKVSQGTYREIREKLLEAGYDDQLHQDDAGAETFDLHGIAIEPSKAPLCLVPGCSEEVAVAPICDDHWDESRAEYKLPLLTVNGRWDGWVEHRPGAAARRLS